MLGYIVQNILIMEWQGKYRQTYAWLIETDTDHDGVDYIIIPEPNYQ